MHFNERLVMQWSKIDPLSGRNVSPNLDEEQFFDWQLPHMPNYLSGF
jgi:hypothetical protein